MFLNDRDNSSAKSCLCEPFPKEFAPINMHIIIAKKKNANWGKKSFPWDFSIQTTPLIRNMGVFKAGYSLIMLKKTYGRQGKKI